EVTRDQPRPLVDQLVEGVLPVGSRLAPVDRAGLAVDLGSVERHVLPVALHRELLEVGRESLQVLFVGQHRHGLGPEEVVVPYGAEMGGNSAGGGPVARVWFAQQVPGGSASSIWERPRVYPRNSLEPMASMVESPIAEVIEYRPPTQSQNPNMFAVSMPNFVT